MRVGLAAPLTRTVDEAASEGMDPVGHALAAGWRNVFLGGGPVSSSALRDELCRSHANSMRHEWLRTAARYRANARFKPSRGGAAASIPSRGVLPVAADAGPA